MLALAFDVEIFDLQVSCLLSLLPFFNLDVDGF